MAPVRNRSPRRSGTSDPDRDAEKLLNLDAITDPCPKADTCDQRLGNRLRYWVGSGSECYRLHVHRKLPLKQAFPMLNANYTCTQLSSEQWAGPGIAIAAIFFVGWREAVMVWIYRLCRRDSPSKVYSPIVSRTHSAHPTNIYVLLLEVTFHHKVFRLIKKFKYYYSYLYNQTSRLIDPSEQRR